MKALIFNSGSGSRMGQYTENFPKCLLDLNGESILHRQLRLLFECGIRDIIVTTGKYHDEIKKETEKIKDIRVEFVYNPLYASTNYIYSMYLAAPFLDDDIIMLHGDLVFEKSILERLLTEQSGSFCLVNPSVRQPLKDFKGRITEGYLREVSIEIFDNNCFAFQPMYRLSKEAMLQWLDQTKKYVETNKVKVYAENALNEILSELHIVPISYEGYFISEVDTPKDYDTVRKVWNERGNHLHFGIKSLKELSERYHPKRVFTVMGRHLSGSETEKFLKTFKAPLTIFTDVIENPTEESVAKAKKVFEKDSYDMLISIGGGSVIDTAKAVKYEIGNKALVHIAIPTTAGSGSEATPYAVVCRNGAKYTIHKKELLPDEVILDAQLLEGLTPQQKKVSMLDALCHSIESMMSPDSSTESRNYSKKSIDKILRYYKRFIEGDPTVNEKILTASYEAGKAISLTKTSVGHAMSYVLTTEYSVQHGQAAALCLIYALKYVERNGYRDELQLIYQAMECRENTLIYEKLFEIYKSMKLEHSFDLSKASARSLAEKADLHKLNNSVIPFDKEAVETIMCQLLEEGLNFFKDLPI